MNKDECCPKFDPKKWDNKTINWKDKMFVKDKVFTLFYMPIGFGSTMKRLDEKTRKSGAKVLDNLCLSYHTSMWNMEVYLAVDRKIPNSENVTISGKFFSKVYEGPYKNTGMWCKEYVADANKKKMKVKKMYMWYTTCPKCAKKYGKNYIVIISEVK
ncbi:MAG: hydrolase [Candidatus Aenigmatarchaeota archaeon]